MVAGRHHRHRKVRLRPTDCADQLAAHLLDRAEHVPDAGTRLGHPPVAPLLALRQRLVALALPLDLVAKAIALQPGFPLPVGEPRPA